MLEPRLQNYKEIIDLINSLNIDYAVIGGIAYGFWVEPRVTKDLDLTISLDDNSWLKLKSELELIDPNIRFHFESPEMPYLMRFKIKNGLPVDLLVSLTPYQDEILKRKQKVFWANQNVNVASAEDLIVSKLIAHRSQDLVDVEKILKHITNLDKNYIVKWAKEWEVEQYWEKILANQ